MCIRDRVVAVWSYLKTDSLSAQETLEKPAAQQKGEKDDDESSNDEFDVNLQLETFDEVWSTIKRVHWDPEKVGEKWEKARDKFRPRVEAAKSLNETRAIIGELITSLGQSHFGIIPAESYDAVSDDDDKESSEDDGDTGLMFRQYKDLSLIHI